jgi:Leucine-rich repeat (LRR) protein
MANESDPEGWKIALERIAAERTNPTGILDLGCLGLTELPTEVFELTDLFVLNLGVDMCTPLTPGKPMTRHPSS